MRLDWWTKGSAWAFYLGLLLWLGAFDGVPWAKWFGKEPAVGIAQVFSAIGTAAAAIVALWLAGRSERREDAASKLSAQVRAARSHAALIRVHGLVATHCLNILPKNASADRVLAEFILMPSLGRRLEAFTGNYFDAIAPLGDRLARKLAQAFGTIELALEEAALVRAFVDALPQGQGQSIGVRMIEEGTSRWTCILALATSHAQLGEVLAELAAVLRLEAVAPAQWRQPPLPSLDEIEAQLLADTRGPTVSPSQPAGMYQTV